MAFKVPAWLKRIPAGNYTINELIPLTRVSAANIYMRLAVLKVERTYTRIGFSWKNIYHWKGALYYISQAYEQETKAIEEL